MVLSGAASFAQNRVKLGEISFGGAACQVDTSDTLTAVIKNGRLQIPLTSTIRKPANERIERGACQFSLPLRLPSHYRLVLKDASVIGSVNLASRAEARLSVEIFQAGSQNIPMISEVNAGAGRLNKQIHLRRKGEVFVSECGAQMILRGNASVILQGDGRASGSLYYISTKAKLEQCG